MRITISKFFALAVVAILAFAATPPAARAQDASAAIAQAVAGDSTALNALIASNPSAVSALLANVTDAATLTAVGNAFANALQAGGPNAQAVADALVASNNSALVSGVIGANGLSSAAQTLVATELTKSGDKSLIVAVTAELATAGKIVPPVLANASSTIVAQAITNGTPVVVPVNLPSPAQVVVGSPA
jgi:hypothetical protein